MSSLIAMNFESSKSSSSIELASSLFISSTIFNSTTSFQVGTGSNTLDFNVPFDVNFEKNNYLKGNLGIRAKLTFFTLHFERTFANYPISTLGIGFSFR